MRSSTANLIVGAGFSGAVIAERIASQLNEKVIIIDKKSHIAGNSFDYVDENGIFIHKYGSHIFHTSNKKVWDYMKNFGSFNTYMHRVVGLIDGIEGQIPFNLNTIYEVFPKSTASRLEEKLLENFAYNTKVPILEFQKQQDKDLKFLAEFVYEKVFLHYTSKQWGLNPKETDSSVTARVPVFISKDNRYFQDKYQGIPNEGYSGIIKNMLTHKNIEISLDTSFEDVRHQNFSRIFHTGSIDEFFDYKFGILPYRSVSFEFETHNLEFYQSNSVVNYPCNYDFTRIHEYKHYLRTKSSKTVIAKEYSHKFDPAKNERFYPIANEKNHHLYSLYKEESKKSPNLFFLGRLGDYKYYDMDKAIERALEVFESLCPQKKTDFENVNSK